MSKIEAGRLTLDPVDTDLDALLLDLRALFELRVQQGSVELRLERDPTVPRYISVDPLRLRQVLINLIGNSVKFTSRGSICRRCRSARRTSRPCWRITSPNIARASAWSSNSNRTWWRGWWRTTGPATSASSGTWWKRW
jgi:signal transduction histidine kinase